MSAFSVDWTEQAKTDLSGLHPEVQAMIMRKVESAKSDPIRYFQRLRGETAWRLRAGDYRVIADVVLTARKVIVLAVGHRRNVYR